MGYALGWITLERERAGGKTLMHNESNTMWYAVVSIGPNRDFAVPSASNIAGRDGAKAIDATATLLIKQRF